MGVGTDISAIVSQHVEDAADGYRRRSRASEQPSYKLSDLVELDHQLVAELDGLRIASSRPDSVTGDSMEQGDVGDVFVAASLALGRDGADDLTSVITQSATLDGSAAAVAAALSWLAPDRAAPHLVRFLQSADPHHQAIGVEGASSCRYDPGQVLEFYLSRSDTEVRWRALRLTGELGRRDLVNQLHSRENHSELERFWAAWASALLNGSSGQHGSWNPSLLSEPLVEIGIPVAVRSASVPNATRLTGVLNGWHLIGAWAAQGLADHISWVITQMSDPDLARAAGEAFSMITGVDLAYEDLETDAPADFEASPNDDPEDENVAMDPDEDLPWPDVQKVEKWWGENRHRFQPGVRYLCGRPINEETCWWVLEHGYQRQRAAAAIELALLKPGRPLFNVTAPAWRQLNLIHKRQTA